MVFRNNSPKGITGEIMSDSKKLKLSGYSRWLQNVALNGSGRAALSSLLLLLWLPRRWQQTDSLLAVLRHVTMLRLLTGNREHQSET